MQANKPHFNLAYFKLSSHLNSNVSECVLMAIKTYRKLKCYVSTDGWNGQWHKAKSRRICFYKHPNPRYEATFLITLEQRDEIAISLCRQFWTFAQLLAVPLANLWVSDSLTMKIETVKISETRILVFFLRKFVPTKITKHTVVSAHSTDGKYHIAGADIVWSLCRASGH